MAKQGKDKTLADLERQRRRLRRQVPSEPWVDALVHGPVNTLPDGMVKCPTCGVSFPPYYVDGQHCFECHLAALSPRTLARLSRWG